MEYETMDQFTDDLLKEKILNCKICDKFCTSDIFVVKDKGNVCGQCFEEKCSEEMRSRAELNTALIIIIAKLMLPCEFQSKGCNKRVRSKMYYKHVKSCDFKTKPCPMKNLEMCDWNGSRFELTDHLLENHDKHVIKGHNNIFKMETSFSKLFDIKVLSFDCQNYLLRTLIADNKFYYAISPLEKNDESMEYSVVHRSVEKSNLSALKTIGTLTKLNGFFNEHNLNKNPNATEVDLDSLKHLINEDKILNHFNLNPKELDEKMVKLLECPVCLSTMRPPIYLCERGHDICISCLQKVDKCPTCEGKWTDARNFSIENMATDFKYPCKFKQFGCKENGVQDYIKKHEEECLYLSKILRCQICKNIMRPPIFDCNSGHGVCFECKENSNRCPTCKDGWTNTRNNALESLTFNVKYPCQNNKLGCKEISIANELSKHEEICPLSVYECPMYCEESGNFQFILKHIKYAHKCNEYTGYQIIPKHITREYSYFNWIIFDSRVFRLSFFKDLEGFTNCAVELVCSNENPALYTYVLLQPNITTRSYLCQKEGQTKLIFNQPLIINIKKTNNK